MARLKEIRLQRDDFEILKVIGRGAFSEVSPDWLLELERPLRWAEHRSWGGSLEIDE